MRDLVIVWDTETGGIPDLKWGLGDPRQPDIVSIAAALYRPDGTIMSEFNMIVLPELKGDGSVARPIPDEVAKIHGITTEVALACGVPLRTALSAFVNLRSRAAESVAHNQEFDQRMVEIAFAKLGVQPSSPWPARMTCTAQSPKVAELVGLPPTAKQKKWKPDVKFKVPNLTELHAFLFGEGFSGAHGAGPDRDACARCFFELRKRGTL